MFESSLDAANDPECSGCSQRPVAADGTLFWLLPNCAGLGSIAFISLLLLSPVRARENAGEWPRIARIIIAGFVAAIGIHPIVGYNDLGHLAPAIIGAPTSPYSCPFLS